jgi:hypothetical protein
MKTENLAENEKMLLYIPKFLSKKLREEAEKNYRSISGEVAFILA